MGRLLTAILSCTALSLLAFGAWRAGSMAIADHYAAGSDYESLHRAVALEPRNASHHWLLAEHAEGLGQDPKPDLRAALSLSPEESRYWLRMAFRQETEGDLKGAEASLLRAAERDHMVTPAWSLASFYQRRGDVDQFWRWASKALQVTPPEPELIFRTAWQMTPDAAKLRAALPPRREILRRYLSWLISAQLIAEAVGPAHELAADATAEDLGALLNFTDWAAVSDLPNMLSIWNSLVAHKLVPGGPLSLSDGELIADPTFQARTEGHGFSWFYASQPGRFVTPLGTSDGLTAEVSGATGDNFVLMRARVPLEAGRRYRLTWEYRLSGKTTPSGIRWQIFEPLNDLNTLDQTSIFSGTDWHTGELEFPAKIGGAARLALLYQREPATVPWDGVIHLRRVGLRAIP